MDLVVDDLSFDTDVDDFEDLKIEEVSIPNQIAFTNEKKRVYSVSQKRFGETEEDSKENILLALSMPELAKFSKLDYRGENTIFEVDPADSVSKEELLNHPADYFNFGFTYDTYMSYREFALKKFGSNVQKKRSFEIKVNERNRSTDSDRNVPRNKEPSTRLREETNAEVNRDRLHSQRDVDMRHTFRDDYDHHDNVDYREKAMDRLPRRDRQDRSRERDDYQDRDRDRSYRDIRDDRDNRDRDWDRNFDRSREPRDSRDNEFRERDPREYNRDSNRRFSSRRR
eukprot:TRINITY_DN3228_c1_g4_i1.p1 TRINITY_DN3228_c1_g4~~TRINITY_DN3228_c1_g4_i1.p1  ORF type:complete len:293 (-),score=58.67 TRINITY_DN3228_c1_g4_i1:22-873(-)